MVAVDGVSIRIIRVKKSFTKSPQNVLYILVIVVDMEVVNILWTWNGPRESCGAMRTSEDFEKQLSADLTRLWKLSMSDLCRKCYKMSTASGSNNTHLQATRSYERKCLITEFHSPCLIKAGTFFDLDFSGMKCYVTEINCYKNVICEDCLIFPSRSRESRESCAIPGI